MIKKTIVIVFLLSFKIVNCQFKKANVLDMSIWKILNVKDSFEISSIDTLKLNSYQNENDTLEYYPTLTFYKKNLIVKTYKLIFETKTNEESAKKVIFRSETYNYVVDSANCIVKINTTKGKKRTFKFQYCFTSSSSLLIARLNPKKN
jgi:hypothetical protein